MMVSLVDMTHRLKPVVVMTFVFKDKTRKVHTTVSKYLTREILVYSIRHSSSDWGLPPLIY